MGKYSLYDLIFYDLDDDIGIILKLNHPEKEWCNVYWTKDKKVLFADMRQKHYRKLK